VPSAKNLFIITGPWSFAMSAVAITAGTLLAGLQQLNLAFYILALTMVVPVHASSNLLNDCYDVVTGADRPGTMVFKPHPILTGILSLRSTATYAGALMALGTGAGVELTLAGRPYSLGIVAAAIALMLCYNVPPLRLKERGLGEALVFVVWGPLMFLGSYYLQTDTLAVLPMVFSVPLGLLVASVLLVDDVRDIEEDKAIGRTTIATALGKKRALQLYLWLIALSYAAAALFGFFFDHPWLLLVLLSAPVAIVLGRRFRTELPRVAPDRIAAQLVIFFGLLYALAIAV
jgi:1,4-dihydroxy-2-naphthoate octaprenyltransferase